MQSVEQSNPDCGIHQFNQPFAAVNYESIFLHLFLLHLELLILINISQKAEEKT